MNYPWTYEIEGEGTTRCVVAVTEEGEIHLITKGPAIIQDGAMYTRTRISPAATALLSIALERAVDRHSTVCHSLLVTDEVALRS